MNEGSRSVTPLARWCASLFVPLLAFLTLFMSSGALVDVKFFARFSFNKLSSSGSVPFSYNAMNTSVILLLLKKQYRPSGGIG
jgi:hypothetical protein